jgi:hypothetical protein
VERQALRAAAWASAWLCLLAGLLPFERLGASVVWPWWGLLDAGPWDALALLLPLLGAFGSAGLALWARPKASLAAGLLLGLGALSALAWLAGRQPHPLPVYAHLAIGLPPLFERHLGLLLAGLATLVAGIRLGAAGFLEPLEGRPPPCDARSLARALTALGLALVGLVYLLPQRGEFPLWASLREVFELLLGGGLAPGQAAALLAGHALSLAPLVLAGLSLPRLWRPAPAFGGALPLVLLGYLPALALLTGLRHLPVNPTQTLLHLRAAALLGALVWTGGLALPALVRGLGFEIPWLLGRLGRIDLVLAVALSTPEPEAGLRASLARLMPWGRVLARRRLGLWRAVADEVPGAARADLPAVIRYLERRWREEHQAGGGEQEPPQRLPDWPWWMRSAWPAAGLGLLVVGFALEAWGGARPPDPARPWPLGPCPPAVETLLVERLPEVVLELSQSPQPLERLPAWGDFLAAARAAEVEVPGLGRAVGELLEAGRHGVRRAHSLRRARDRVNRRLRSASVPLILSARLRQLPGEDAGLFLGLVYRIRHSPAYRLQSDGRAFTVLMLERADPLNVVEGYMGMAEEAEAHVSVYLDRLQAFAHDRLQAAAQRFGPVGEAVRVALAELGLDPLAVPEPGGPLDGLVLEGLVRHELHHRLYGLEPEPPALLWRLLGAYPEEAVRGVTSELGAYLGELALGATYIRLRLAWMLDELDEPEGREGYHGWARMFLVSHLLGDELGGELCWEGACRLGLARRLVTLPGEELLGRVDRLHRALFDESAPRFERVPTGANPDR